MKLVDLNISEVNEDAGALKVGKKRTVQADAVRIFICGGHWFGLIPPLGVVNEFFTSGSTGGKEENADVIYEWEPFELDKAEYNEFVKGVVNLPGEPFKKDLSIPEDDWSEQALLRSIEQSGEDEEFA